MSPGADSLVVERGRKRGLSPARLNRTVPGGNRVDAEGNCWESEHHFPLWFSGDFADRRECRVGCDGAPEFLMNEN